MNRMITSPRRLAALLLVLLGGCLPDGGGSSGGDDAPTGPPPPAEPTSLFLLPGGQELMVGEEAMLVCYATYEDGADAEVAVAWSLSAPEVLSVTVNGSRIQVTATGFGRCTVTAHYGTLTAEAPFEVINFDPERDPGQIIAGSGNGLYRYPTIGGGARTTLWTAPAGNIRNGMASDLGGNNIYMAVQDPSSGTPNPVNLYKYSVAAETTTLVESGWLTGAIAGMDSDPLGRIYVNVMGIVAATNAGSVVRYDPATRVSTVAANSGSASAYIIDIAIGPGNAVHLAELLVSTGGVWAYRVDPVDGSIEPWAVTRSPGTAGGLVIAGGLDFSGGAAMMAASFDNKVYRFQDVNGDGDALDEGEHPIWGTMPFTASVTPPTTVIGVTALGAGRGAMVNVQEGSTKGIFWLSDRNLDGRADDEGEAVTYHSAFVGNNNDCGCLLTKTGGFPMP